MNHGKTRQLNFYNIDNKFYFVDLPGYGYSKMSKQLQEQVGSFIEEYIFNRNNISLIIFLVDIRHKPTENDKLMLNYLLNVNIPFIILANKADKISITKVENYIKDIKNEFKIDENILVLPFSSERKIYSNTILNEIEKYI